MGSVVGVAGQTGEGCVDEECIPLQEAVVAEAATTTVMPNAECATVAALDVLSDAEHFGVFMGHVVSLGPSMSEIRDELATLPQMEGDAEAWLADLAADPDAAAQYLAGADRWATLLDDELTWLEAHPPRACWAEAHEAWRGWADRAGATMRGFSTALRVLELELPIQANADLEEFRAGAPPDIYALGQTCWLAGSTITVVPNAECAPDAALDVLSDAEHFGLFMGHVVSTIPALEAMRDEPRTVPEAGYAGTWLAELAADPDALASNLAVSDRLVALVDDELAWLEAHPPRPCWAEAHEAWLGWADQIAATTRGFSTALRRQDVELLIQANADMKALEASEAADISSLGQTCWLFTD